MKITDFLSKEEKKKGEQIFDNLLRKGEDYYSEHSSLPKKKRELI